MWPCVGRGLVGEVMVRRRRQVIRKDLKLFGFRRRRCSASMGVCLVINMRRLVMSKKTLGIEGYICYERTSRSSKYTFYSGGIERPEW
jgi:hypothetical protein